MTDVVIIQTDGEIKEATVPDGPEELESLQKLVGGYIELIDMGDGAGAFVNEEGKLKELPHNIKATFLARLQSPTFRADWIAGPMVLVGRKDEEITDVPFWLVELAKRA